MNLAKKTKKPMSKKISFDYYNEQRLCNQCGEPAKFFDGTNNYWWCGMTFYAHGYCKKQKEKTE